MIDYVLLQRKHFMVNGNLYIRQILIIIIGFTGTDYEGLVKSVVAIAYFSMCLIDHMESTNHSFNLCPLTVALMLIMRCIQTRIFICYWKHATLSHSSALIEACRPTKLLHDYLVYYLHEKTIAIVHRTSLFITHWIPCIVRKNLWHSITHSVGRDGWSQITGRYASKRN